MHAVPVLRPAQPEDVEFLFRVYASTREDELTATGWNADQQRSFLLMQFNAQDRHYRGEFPRAQFYVIEVDGTPVGRLYLDRAERETRILDISLLPAFRNQGIGTMLLNDIMMQAARDASTVVIHVERHNRSVQLYSRLGFVPVEESAVYLRMVCSPGQEKIA